MADGDLKLGIFEHEPFFELMEGRRRARQSRSPQAVGLASGRLPAPRVSHAKPATRPNNSARVATMLRVAAKAPEVMVKVTGRDRSMRQAKAHLAYLGRDEHAKAELNDGQILFGKQAIKEAVELMNDGRDADEKERPLTVHVMFSMAAGTASAEEVLAASRATASEIFRGHEYVLVLHVDKAHKHVHAVVAATARNGRQLRHYKPQLQQWREAFARELRTRGVLAEATPRVVRGVVEKSVNRSVRAIRDERAAQRRAGQTLRPAPKVDLVKVSEALRAARSEPVSHAKPEQGRPERPWERAVQKNRAVVLSAWEQFSADLKQFDTRGARAAEIVDSFRREIPPVVFERDRLEVRARAAVERLARDSTPSVATRPRIDTGLDPGLDPGKPRGRAR